MPVVRIDIPQGNSLSRILDLKRRIEASIGRSWAKEHIYIAVRETIAEAGDRTVMMTVDLRPGRGQEEQRAAALYADVLQALEACIEVDPERFVLLIREFPERNFVVAGGQLPPLDEITPPLA